MSYSVGAPIMVGNYEVIKGTSSFEDVANWPSVLTGRPRGKLWTASAALSKRFRPVGYVGHSLGAAWAHKLSERSGARYIGYGRPGVGASVVGDIMNAGDPVSMLLLGHKALRLGHSLAAYG